MTKPEPVHRNDLTGQKDISAFELRQRHLLCGGKSISVLGVGRSNRTATAPVKMAWASKYPEKVCRIFVESGTRDLNAIVDAADARDQQKLLARIHSMKGALLMLGEQDVATLCASMEKHIDAEGIEAALSEIERFEVAMRNLLEHYAESL